MLQLLAIPILFSTKRVDSRSTCKLGTKLQTKHALNLDINWVKNPQRPMPTCYNKSLIYVIPVHTVVLPKSSSLSHTVVLPKSSSLSFSVEAREHARY